MRFRKSVTVAGAIAGLLSLSIAMPALAGKTIDAIKQRGQLVCGVNTGLAGYSQLGMEPAWFFAWGSTLIELLGGIGIILGLFTRFCAAAVAIEMFVIFCLYWNNGFAWLSRGYEYVLLWGLVAFAIALRGGGPYSLDRKIGFEL